VDSAHPSPAEQPPPTAYIDQAADNYYVEMTACASDSTGAPVTNNKLMLMLSDSSGNSLAGARVTTGMNGCFTGDVDASGGAASVIPAAVSLTDSSGAVTALAVGPGSPAYRPPAAAIPSI
jgi:hypothetical protein